MRKEYHKLVRDNIPDIIADNGQAAQVRVLSDDEYAAALRCKLTEEVGEYLESGAVEELADIMEVAEALAALQNVSFAELLALKEDKQRKNGAFRRRLWLESAEDARHT